MLLTLVINFFHVYKISKNMKKIAMSKTLVIISNHKIEYN